MSDTMTISATDVNKLRKQTGAGMMDCKNALMEANGDFDEAVVILRKKGQKIASNRADKEAAEGMIIAKTSDDKKRGVLIELNCETDFVAKNDDFINFVNTILDKAINENPDSLEALKSLEHDGLTIADSISDQMGKIGEKLDLSTYERIEAPHVEAYIHPGSKLSVLVGFSNSISEELSKNIAMQIAAMNPLGIDKDDVDSSMVEQEKEIAMDQLRQEGKPEDLVEKIAMGKLNKFFKENTLLNQVFVKDNSKTISQILSEAGSDLTVTEFKRVSLSN